MIRNIKTQWIILSRSIVFNASLILWILSLWGFPLIIYKLSQNGNSDRFDKLKDAFSFSIVFNTVSVLELCIPLHLMSLTIIVLICQEIESKTYRLHLLHGSSRYQIWLDSLALTLILSILMMTLSIAVAFSLGLLVDGNLTNLESFEPLRWHLILLFQAFSYFNFSISLSLIFKRIGIAILVYILWFGGIERTIAQILNFNPPFNWYPVGDLFPGKSIEELSHFKVLEILGTYIYHKGYETLKQTFALIWCFVSIVFNYQFYKRIAY